MVLNNKCPPGKILNPKTNRCVKKDGKIGREILKKTERKKSSNNTNKCPYGKILNPKTNRCVKKDGKIGREILQKANKISKKTYNYKHKKSKKCLSIE